jgi:hypothetical protein
MSDIGTLLWLFDALYDKRKMSKGEYRMSEEELKKNDGC